MRESLKKLMAFTLSEVLITLGIIGVVSTLTLPNLTNSYRRNVAMTKIEKGYAQIAQAYEQMLDDRGDASVGEFRAYSEAQSDEDGYADRNNNARNYFNNYWANFLKSPIFCETAADCGYSVETPFILRNGNTIIELRVVDPQERATFMTNEGIVYLVNVAELEDDPYSYTNRATVVMDINGGKSPNMLGKDVFMFTRTTTDGLMPWDYDSGKTKEEFRTQCYTYGNDCAEYLRRNGWEAPRDYQF